jgi:hypothetical protein
MHCDFYWERIACNKWQAIRLSSTEVYQLRLNTEQKWSGICSIGCLHGVRLSFADVSEPSVRSIFKGTMWCMKYTSYTVETPNRTYTWFRTRRKFEIKKSDQDIYFLLTTKKLKIQLQAQNLLIYTIKYSNILWKG